MSGADAKTTTTKPVLIIDGRRTTSLEAFFHEVNHGLLGYPIGKIGCWGYNLDAFNDILRGGFGTPEGGYIIKWIYSEHARDALGYKATIAWRQQKMKTCHPSWHKTLEKEIEDARKGRGETLFDKLVEIIHVHCPGGRESGDGVELILA